MSLDDEIRRALVEIQTERAQTQLDMGWADEEPHGRYRSVYRVVQSRLDAATKRAKLALPARVFIVHIKGIYDGRYCGDELGYHAISLRPELSVLKADQVIWHELAHAKQSERLGSAQAFHEEYLRLARQMGTSVAALERNEVDINWFYRTHKLEVEAMKWEQKAINHPITERRDRARLGD